MKGQTGFTLLEALVAFAVLALSLGVIAQIFGQGARAAASGRDYALAGRVAESRLSEAMVHADTTAQGREGPYQWQLDYSPHPPPAHATEDWPLEQLRVRVHWQDGTGAERSLELHGLRWDRRQ